jgi:hypothetical protein
MEDEPPVDLLGGMVSTDLGRTKLPLRLDWRRPLSPLVSVEVSPPQIQTASKT